MVFLGQKLGDPQLRQLGATWMVCCSSGKVEQCLLDDAEPIKGAAIVSAKGSEDDVGEIEDVFEDGVPMITKANGEEVTARTFTGAPRAWANRLLIREHPPGTHINASFADYVGSSVFGLFRYRYHTERSQSLGNVSTVAAAASRVESERSTIPRRHGSNKQKESPAEVLQEYHRLLLQAGYSPGKKSDGSAYKYVNYMRLLFDNGIFSKRADFFADGAKDKAMRFYQEEAARKKSTNTTKEDKLMSSFRHGFQHFIELAPKPSDMVSPPSSPAASVPGSPAASTSRSDPEQRRSLQGSTRFYVDSPRIRTSRILSSRESCRRARDSMLDSPRICTPFIPSSAGVAGEHAILRSTLRQLVWSTGARSNG